jgi:hypothetical protein
MKRIFSIAACATLFTLSACDNKEEIAQDKTILNQEVAQSSVPNTLTAPVVKTVATPASVVTPTEVIKAVQVNSAVSPATKKSAAPAPIPADQFLAETITQAREKTNSQTSPSRQRGQRAEDEMTMEIAPPK